MTEHLLAEHFNKKVYLAKDEKSGVSFIKKVLDTDTPSDFELAQFFNEQEILSKLKIPGIRKLSDSYTENNKHVLALEYFDGFMLNEIFHPARMEWGWFFEVIEKVSDTISELHASGLIHNSICPANILVNPKSLDTCIIDFDYSSFIQSKTVHIGNPVNLTGNLAYISPEQTGRLNAIVDNRSDLYALGISLFEVLTGHLPFAAEDPIELIHSHIARPAPKVIDINPKIPDVISRMVEKLMAKNADLRYQSVAGFKNDIVKLRNLFIQHGEIKDIQIGQEDYPLVLSIPQKLYGREDEVKMLLQSFEQVASGSKARIFMVGGYSGVGKTALVQEVYSRLSEKKGYFLKGKYDQFQRNVPYFAIIEALKEYVSYLLVEPEEKKALMKQEILEALGNEGALLIRLIPALEQIIGYQKPVSDLLGLEAQNRFHYIFSRFINCISKPDSPIVMFIDDLQWADSASQQLLYSFVRDKDLKNLLLVGAYRDNEVSPTHPSMVTLKALEKEGVAFDWVNLENLTDQDVHYFLSDTLKASKPEIDKLNLELYSKTRGNAFYLVQILETLAKEGIFQFDRKSLSWKWDIAKIHDQQITDSVIDLLTGKLRQFDEKVLDMLKTASCIGNQFPLEYLKAIHHHPAKEIQEKLEIALVEGLLQKRRNIYSFIHDRIQQAAYSLIDDNLKTQRHFEIGELLYAISPEKGSSDEQHVFNVVNQLNEGEQLVKDVSIRDEYGALNLRAGFNAKNSSAYGAAHQYFKHAIKFFDDRWEDNFAELVQANTNAADSAYLNGEFEITEEYIQIVLDHAVKLIDKINVLTIRIGVFQAQNRFQEAVDEGLKMLKLTGIKMARKPSQINVLKRMVVLKTLLLGKKIEKLDQLPEMKDEIKLASFRLLVSIGPSIYYSSPNLTALAIFEMTNLSLRYGNCDESAFAYSTYGLFCCGYTNEFNTGYRFGQLAIKIADKFKGPNQARGVWTANCFVNHWTRPLRESLKPFLDSYDLALNSGDLEFAALAAYLYCNHSFYSGRNLNELSPEMNNYSKDIKQLKQFAPLKHTLIHWQAAKNLMGEVSDPKKLKGDVYNEDTEVKKHLEIKDNTAMMKYYLQKVILNYLFGDEMAALELSLKAEKYLESVRAMMVYGIFHFYQTLVIIAMLEHEEDKKSRKKLKVRLGQLKLWAKNSPANYAHKYELARAELYRIEGKIWKAREAYDMAITLAKENDFTNELALANELHAKHLLKIGKTQLAGYYLKQAYDAYQQWGAQAKCQDIKASYPQFFVESKVSQEVTSSSVLQTMDLSSLVKASTAISGEIKLKKLSKKLLTIVSENIGAERGYLLLYVQATLMVFEKWSISKQVVQKWKPYQAGEDEELPQTIINNLKSSKELIVIDNAEIDPQYSSDPRVKSRNVQSVIGLPIISQKSILGYLYLENNQLSGAFSEERVEMMKLLSGQIAISLSNAKLFNDLEESYEDQVKLKKAYSRFVPREFLKTLGKESIVDINMGDQVQGEMTIMFTDIESYTTMSESMTPEENFEFMNQYFGRVTPIINQNKGFVCQFTGDGFMAIFREGADYAYEAAVEIQKELKAFNKERDKMDLPPIKIGIGLHTGKVIMGVIGNEERMDQNVLSDAVNIASRVQDLTREYGASFIVTDTIIQALKGPVPNRFLGNVSVKGRSEPVAIYECTEGKSK